MCDEFSVKSVNCRLVQNENNSRKLLLYIPEEYSDKNVSLSFLTPGGQHRFSDFIAISDGIGEYYLPVDVLDNKGILLIQVNISDADGNYLLKSSIFRFPVTEDIGGYNPTPVDNLKTYTIADLLTKFNNYVAKPDDTTPAEFVPVSDGLGGYLWQYMSGGGGSDPNAVKYTVQTRTEAEKTIARGNIGAVDGQYVESEIISATTGLATTSYVDGKIDDLNGELSVVAKTGSYLDLSDLPVNLSEFTNDLNFATEDFVNSSISTNTAYFKGTFNSVADLPTTGVTNNDYAFIVGTDIHGNTTYTRYKYNSEDTVWVEEYVLNNSSFTDEQWAAIQSGITSALVTQIGTNTTNIGNKQSKTIIDAGGYFTTDTVEGALQEIGSTLDGLDEALEALL